MFYIVVDVLGKKFLIIFTTYKICELNYNSRKLQFLCISTWPGSCGPKENNSKSTHSNPRAHTPEALALSGEGER